MEKNALLRKKADLWTERIISLVRLQWWWWSRELLAYKQSKVEWQEVLTFVRFYKKQMMMMITIMIIHFIWTNTAHNCELAGFFLATTTCVTFNVVYENDPLPSIYKNKRKLSVIDRKACNDACINMSWKINRLCRCVVGQDAKPLRYSSSAIGLFNCYFYSHYFK